MTLEQVTLPVSASSETVLSILRAKGIAILPGYFKSETLQGLKEEFDRIIHKGKALGFNVMERPGAVTVAIIRNRLSEQDYPTIMEVFAYSIMAEIAHFFYNGSQVGLNHQIYANLNRETGEGITELPFVPHFDKIQTLKFFVYLTDTMAENGAMKVIPESHFGNREHRLQCISLDKDYHSVTNLVVGSEPTLPVEGRAGTLLIFDSDVTHNAGHVYPGNERRILRGHTRTVAELDKLGLSKETIDNTTI